MLPAVESRLNAVVLTVPTAALVRSFFDVSVTLVSGVAALPIAAPTLKPPLAAVSSTVPLVLAASIVAVVASVVALLAVKLKSVPADDAPLIVTVPVAVSLIVALVAALAWIFATFVVNAFAKLVPPIPPAVELRLKLVANIVPVMFVFNRLSCEVKVTVPIGVVALPMFAPMFRPPAWAVNSTVAFGFVLPASIVAVVASVVALVAIKLKSVPADDAPFIVTVPVAESEIFTLPAAFAVISATEVLNEVPGVVP